MCAGLKGGGCFSCSVCEACVWGGGGGASPRFRMHGSRPRRKLHTSIRTHLPEQPAARHRQRQGRVAVTQNHVPRLVHRLDLLGRHQVGGGAAPTPTAPAAVACRRRAVDTSVRWCVGRSVGLVFLKSMCFMLFFFYRPPTHRFHPYHADAHTQAQTHARTVLAAGGGRGVGRRRVRNEAHGARGRGAQGGFELFVIYSVFWWW